MKKLIIILKKINKILRKIEEYILTFFLFLITIFGFLQIVLRKFGTTEWFTPLIKFAVLWIAMIAASMATADNKHIKIDIIGRFAKGRLKSIILAITNLFAAIICLIIGVISINYLITIEFPSTDPPPFLNIPRWILLVIMPIGFITMSLRFLFQTGKKIYNIVINKEDDDKMDQSKTEYSVDLNE